MIQFTKSKWLLILGLAVLVLLGATGILTYQLIQETNYSKSLEASEEVRKKYFEEQTTEYTRQIDSLKKVSSAKDPVIEYRVLKIEDFKEYFNSIRYDSQPIDRLTNSDSIDKLFTRYYPRN